MTDGWVIDLSLLLGSTTSSKAFILSTQKSLVKMFEKEGKLLVHCYRLQTSLRFSEISAPKGSNCFTVPDSLLVNVGAMA